ncbi:hypothetical protein [Acinetobacter sp. MD2]|uniref:hypothetical protein n=1 Tax=Acinetobacter sp. MD2 TaxID=2600066 RepID=UPI002D1E8EB3|nr:hypothetical protein [Acinetobacter sp. MD2]MEB3768181.1 hypothetical protein [Acinetobacter sp. MD2]
MFNWLNFFYTLQFQRQYKFIASIAACVCIVILSKQAQAPQIAILSSLALGICLHFFKEARQRFLDHQPAWLGDVLLLLPFIGLMLVTYFYSGNNRFIYFGQYIGFAFLGFILVLTLQYRSKRH